MDDYELENYEGDADEEYPEYLECPKCGSEHTDWVGGDSVVEIGRGLVRYEHYKCANCGHWWRE